MVAGSAWAKTDTVTTDKKNKSNKNLPTFVQADKMTYDENTHIITASGHVEVAQGDEVLHADTIMFNQDTDVVRAFGHVALLRPSGDVMFGEQAELTQDMKQGFVDKVGILFKDNSRLAAQSAQRYEGRYLVANHGVYSACDLCADDPAAPPLWQIEGVRVTHDNVEKRIIYRDATIDFAGVPVFYTPYFSHPDPTVKREDGFLTPSGGATQDLGVYARVPYYYYFSPNNDAVIMPTFSTVDKLQLASEWRYRFDRGTMTWNGSFTHADLVDEYGVDQGQQWRGNLFGTTLFDLDNTWRAGTDVAFTSDKSYLQRYNISSTDILDNRAYVEGFRGRDYAVSNMYYFQDLRPGPQLTEPFVAPDMSFSALGEPGKTFGGRWSMDGGLLVTTRDNNVDPSLQGPDMRRLSYDAGWQRQLVSGTGFLTNFSELARLDGYWVNNVPNPNSPAGTTDFYNTAQLRPFAESDVSVRYPMGRRDNDGGYQHIMEPITVLSLAPQVGSESRLPNEDSLDVEYDETNLFSASRYTGIDRLEGGPRAAYGIRNALIGDNGARIDTLVGQIYRFSPDNNFPVGSGLRDRLADYVGRFDVAPRPWLDMNYGFRANSSNYGLERQELQSSFGVPEFRPSIGYIAVKQTEATTNIVDNVEEATVGFTSNFAKYWTFNTSHVQAFRPDPGSRLTSVGVNYGDECFLFGIMLQNNNTNRLDVAGGNSVLFHFYMKNVGGAHTDASSSPVFLPTSASNAQ